MKESKVDLKNGFTWPEKLLMRAGAAALVGVGAAATWLHHPALAIGYILLVGLGGIGIMYDFLCVYCPYPFKHSDCLFFPYPLVSSIATWRPTPMPRSKKILAAVAFGGVVALPQYALWGRWGLFTAFWGLTVMLGIGIPLHFCRHCRHQHCPINRVPAAGRTRAEARELNTESQ